MDFSDALSLLHGPGKVSIKSFTRGKEESGAGPKQVKRLFVGDLNSAKYEIDLSDGACALRQAKRCNVIALPDALVVASKAPGFFEAFLADSERRSMFSDLVEALKESTESKFGVVLSQLLMQEEGIQLALTFRGIPSTILEVALDRNLSSSSPFSPSLMKSLAHLIGIKNYSQILIQLLTKAKLKVSQNLTAFLGSLDAGEQEELISSCTNVLKDFLGGSFGNVALDNFSSASTLRLVQLIIYEREKALATEQVAYDRWMRDKLEINSASHRLLCEVFSVSLESDPLWALRCHRKVLSLKDSGVRPTKARSQYMNGLRERLADSKEIEREEGLREFAKAVAFFKSSGRISDELHSLQRKRGDFFATYILPLIKEKGPESLTIAFIRQSESSATRVTIDLCEDIESSNDDPMVDALVSGALEVMTDQSVVNLLSCPTKEFDDRVDALGRDLQTFCALIDKPNMRLVSAASKILTTLPPAKNADRLLKLHRLIIRARPVVGDLALKSACQTLLLTSKPLDQLLESVAVTDAELLDFLLTDSVKFAAGMGSIDMCLRLLSSIAVLCRRVEKPLRENAAMHWLCEKLEFQHQAEPFEAIAKSLDEYYAFVAPEKGCGQVTLDDWIELEARSKIDASLSCAAIIIDRTRDRFSADEFVFKSLVFMMQHRISNSPTFVIALQLLLQETKSPERAQILFVNVWIQAAAKLTTSIECHELAMFACDLALALFPRPTLPMSATSDFLKRIKVNLSDQSTLSAFLEVLQRVIRMRS